MQPGCAPLTFEEFKQAAERAFLATKLQEHDWNVSETARTLQMPRSNLYKKIGTLRSGREEERSGRKDKEIKDRDWDREMREVDKCSPSCGC